MHDAMLTSLKIQVVASRKTPGKKNDQTKNVSSQDSDTWSEANENILASVIPEMTSLDHDQYPGLAHLNASMFTLDFDTNSNSSNLSTDTKVDEANNRCKKEHAAMGYDEDQFPCIELMNGLTPRETPKKKKMIRFKKPSKNSKE